jgi:hypothetical protein
MLDPRSVFLRSGDRDACRGEKAGVTDAAHQMGDVGLSGWTAACARLKASWRATGAVHPAARGRPCRPHTVATRFRDRFRCHAQDLRARCTPALGRDPECALLAQGAGQAPSCGGRQTDPEAGTARAQTLYVCARSGGAYAAVRHGAGDPPRTSLHASRSFRRADVASSCLAPSVVAVPISRPCEGRGQPSLPPRAWSGRGSSALRDGGRVLRSGRG